MSRMRETGELVWSEVSPLICDWRSRKPNGGAPFVGMCGSGVLSHIYRPNLPGLPGQPPCPNKIGVNNTKISRASANGTTHTKTPGDGQSGPEKKRTAVCVPLTIVTKQLLPRISPRNQTSPFRHRRQPALTPSSGIASPSRHCSLLPASIFSPSMRHGTTERTPGAGR